MAHLLMKFGHDADSTTFSRNHTAMKRCSTMPYWTCYRQRMLSCLFVVFCIVLGLSYPAFGQRIRLVRSDVDSTRAHFVTATQRFGFNIVLDSAIGCNAAAFEIRFNNPKFVKYSGFSERDFPLRGITVIDLSDTSGGGTGRLSVGVLSGLPANSPGIDNPTVLHLDFVVLPDAPHNATVTFSFNQAQAVLNRDSGVVVTLASAARQLPIRGFIRIWPGDVDNNGLVDTRDFTTLGLFVENTDRTSRFYGFRRQNASTFWSSQRVLSWDSVQATYADCDGNGEVTVADMMVIPANFAKRHTSMNAGDEPGLPSRGAVTPDNSIGGTTGLVDTDKGTTTQRDDLIWLPVRLRLSEDAIGCAGEISWQALPGGAKVVEIRPGELFAGQYQHFFGSVNPDRNHALFSVWSQDFAPQTGDHVVAYLGVEGHSNLPQPMPALDNAVALLKTGQIAPVSMVLSALGEDSAARVIRIEGGDLTFRGFESGSQTTIELFDIFGRRLHVATIPNAAPEMRVSLPTALESGRYFVRVSSATSSFSELVPYLAP